MNDGSIHKLDDGWRMKQKWKADEDEDDAESESVPVPPRLNQPNVSLSISYLFVE